MSNKILCVGDLHGKDVWKSIKFNKYNRIIFLGDYVDSYTHTDEEIIENLSNLIELRKRMPDKVVLLVGNHDIQYFWGKEHMRCSGYRPTYAIRITQLFMQNEHYFDKYWVEGSVKKGNLHLFSHAGLSETFVRKNGVKLFFEDAMPLISFEENKDCLEHIGRGRGGQHHSGGIYWADKFELESDYIDGLHQVVGHTKVKDIVKYGNQDGSVTFIDVLDTDQKFYELKI